MLHWKYNIILSKLACLHVVVHVIPSSSKLSSVIQRMNTINMQSWYLFITTIKIFISFSVVASGLECDAPQILVGNKCQCDERDGCYRPVIYGNCAKMKRCPVGYEPDHTIDMCLPCKTGFFSNKSDCLPCKQLTKCKQQEYVVSPGNTEADTVCASVVNIRTEPNAWTKPDTDVTTRESSGPPSSTTHFNTDDKSTTTLPTSLQPTQSQSEENKLPTDFILYICGIMALCITFYLSCKMCGRQKKINERTQFRRQKRNNAQYSDKTTEESELIASDRMSSCSIDMPPPGPPSYRDSPPPYSRPDASLSSSRSMTHLKELEGSTLHLSEAPPLTFDFKYSTLETMGGSGDREVIQINDYVRDNHWYLSWINITYPDEITDYKTLPMIYRIPIH